MNPHSDQVFSGFDVRAPAHGIAPRAVSFNAKTGVANGTQNSGTFVAPTSESTKLSRGRAP